MKKSICYTALMVLIFILPIGIFAQVNLSGTWRLNESKNFKGPEYSNAIPILIKIEQSTNSITILSTIDNQDRDTIIKESLVYGEGIVNRSITKSGKKRVISFLRGDDNQSWLKQTLVFNQDDSTKLQSLNKESFTMYQDSTGLILVREYDGNGDPAGNQDFIVSGVYEKVTTEQLLKEIETGKGVNFVEGLTWEQIKAKAKAENKFIFVDCYATWCKPCKVMDKYIYPLNIVGEAMNEKYISMKVQMDSLKQDPESIKLLYPLSRKLKQEFNITALPSYLFFSPEGKVLHKAIGQQNSKNFIELLHSVENPERQLYTLFNKAKNKQLPFNEYPALAEKFKEEFQEKDMSATIADVYINNFLDKLPDHDLLTKEHLDFVGKYLGCIKSTNKIFKLCLRQPQLVDSVKGYEGGGWAEALVKRTIINEDVQPILEKAAEPKNEPNWLELDHNLLKKYGKSLATTFVLDARVFWYEKKKDWISFLKYLQPHIDSYELKNVDALHLNYCVWYVFKYSNDPKLMNRALAWIDMAIEKMPQDMLWMVWDTKACLLYKIGRKEESMTLMKQILDTFPQFRSGFQSRINRMTKGEDIWLTVN